MTLLKALQASRQRQAEREIHRYRHLIDEANAAEFRHAIARAHAQTPRRGSSIAATSQAGRMSLKMTTLVVGILTGFAVVHIVGGTLLMARAAHPSAKTEVLLRAD